VSAHNGLQHGAILLSGHAVRHLRLVGPDLGHIGKRATEDVSRIVNIAGGRVALHNTGRCGGRGVDIASCGVLGTVHDSIVRVAQVGLGGELKGEISQVLVELHDLGTVLLLGVLLRVQVAVTDVSRGEVLGELTGVKLVLQSHLNAELGQSHTAERGHLRGHTGDSVEQEVGRREVKLGREEQRRDRSGGVDLGLSGRDLADLTRFNAVNLGIDGRQSGNSDVLGQQVTIATAGQVVVPGIGLRIELEKALVLIGAMK
jgi:hypothetical protein